MKKKDMQKWVKALRSGEYKKCTTQLHDGDGFCCLGVAIDVLVEGDWKKSDESTYEFDNDYGFMSRRVLKKVGLSEKTARFLARNNDNGKSFKWLANWIERNHRRLNE